MARRLVAPLAVLFVSSAPYLFAQDATSLAYQQEIVNGPKGEPVLQLTNTSPTPITAYVVVQTPYGGNGIEGRDYHDSCIWPGNRIDPPIATGHSITAAAGYYVNSRFVRVRAEVRAVVFENGYTAGDPSWIDALLAKRLRFYDDLKSVHDLLKDQIGTGASLPAIIDKLQSARASKDEQLAHDDLHVEDERVFLGAISTLQHSTQPNVSWYAKVLEDYMTKLSQCEPELGTIRTRLAQRPNPEQPIVPPPFAHSER